MVSRFGLRARYRWRRLRYNDAVVPVLFKMIRQIIEVFRDFQLLKWFFLPTAWLFRTGMLVMILPNLLAQLVELFDVLGRLIYEIEGSFASFLFDLFQCFCNFLVVGIVN